MGGLRGKTLVLYRRTAGHGWRVVKKVTTRAGGVFHTSVKVSRTTWFKVAWVGVVHSAVLSVKR